MFSHVGVQLMLLMRFVITELTFIFGFSVPCLRWVFQRGCQDAYKVKYYVYGDEPLTYEF